MTDKSGWVFYWNTETKHTQWHIPGSLPLPKPWAKLTNASGDSYYWNTKTGQMQRVVQGMYVLFSIMICAYR